MLDTGLIVLKLVGGATLLIAFLIALVLGILRLFGINVLRKRRAESDAEIARNAARLAREYVKRRIKELEIKAEDAAQALARQTLPYLDHYCRTFVEKEVVNHPDKAKQLGKDGLADLKKELDRVITRLAPRVKTHIDTKFPWPHRASDVTRTESPEQVETALKERMRFLMGYMGDILVKHGFAKSGPDAEWRPVKPKSKSEKRLMYSWGIDFSPELTTIWIDYVQVLQELKEFKMKLGDVERDREKNEAKRLWEEAS